MSDNVSHVLYVREGDKNSDQARKFLQPENELKNEYGEDLFQFDLSGTNVIIRVVDIQGTPRNRLPPFLQGIPTLFVKDTSKLYTGEAGSCA